MAFPFSLVICVLVFCNLIDFECSTEAASYGLDFSCLRILSGICSTPFHLRRQENRLKLAFLDLKFQLTVEQSLFDPLFTMPE